MKTFKKRSSKKDEIINEECKKIYFCPYCYALCIYEENSQSPRNFQYNNLKKSYKCYSCLKDSLDYSTFADVPRKYGRIPFHDNGKFSDDAVISAIANAIRPLRDQGFSNRNIHAITHFPRALINSVVATQWDESIVIIPIDEFLNKHLGVSSDDSKKDIIEAALLYGCSYAVIRHLVPMRKIEVTKLSKKLCSKSEIKIAINKTKRKIKILEDGVEKRVSITTREKK